MDNLSYNIGVTNLNNSNKEDFLLFSAKDYFKFDKKKGDYSFLPIFEKNGDLIIEGIKITSETEGLSYFDILLHIFRNSIFCYKLILTSNYINQLLQVFEYIPSKDYELGACKYIIPTLHPYQQQITSIEIDNSLSNFSIDENFAIKPKILFPNQKINYTFIIKK